MNGYEQSRSVEHRVLSCLELSNPSGPRQGDVPALLRRVANAIEELGDVAVDELVLHQRVSPSDGLDWPFVVVCYHEKLAKQR